jgi:PAS domain S-box-containing protein
LTKKGSQNTHLKELVTYSEQSATEELLIELAQQRQALDEHSIVGITDSQGTIIYANDKFCSLSGYSREELVGQNHRILNSGIHSRDFFKQMYRTITAGDTWHGEIRNRTKQGAIYWVSTTIVPWKDLAGRITQYVSIRTDITELKETEIKLKHINRHLTEYVENANLCLHWVTPDGRILWANKTELALLGFSKEEYVGFPITKYHADPEAAKILLKKIELAESVNDFETKLIAKDGSTKIVTINCSAYVEDGKHLYSRCFTTDITARKQAETDLEMFFQTSLDLHCIASTDGYFKTINPAFTKTLGWSKEELLSRPIMDFVHLDDRDDTLQQLENMQKGLPVNTFETRFICADKSFKAISWRSIPNGDGKWYATGRDVTLQKIAVENLKQSEEYLATTLKTISEGVVTINAKYQVQRLNQAAEKLTGRTQSSFVGKPITELFKLLNEENNKEEIIPLEQVITSGESFCDSNSTILVGCNNTQTAIDISASPLSDVKGNRIGAVIVLRDVSEARRQKRIIKRQAALLNELKTAQDSFIKNSDGGQAYEYILSILLKFTQSEYGFVGEVLHDKDGNPYLKTHAITNIAWTDDLKSFYKTHAAQGLEFKNLKTLFGHVMTTGNPVISNSPGIDPRRGGLPSGHPDLNAFLGLPIFNDTQMVGMIGAANKKGGYDDKIIEEIQPLLATYATLIIGRRTLQSQRSAEQKVQDQNILLAQKQNLIQEVHHRVKNNLQIISSLLTLQEHQESSPDVIHQLQSSRTRIAAVALLHEILYRSDSFEEINLSDFLSELMQRLKESFGATAAHINFSIRVPKDLMLSQNQAGPLALIINELATNSLKHAFPGNRKGKISLDVQSENLATLSNDKKLIVEVADDGIGMENTNSSTSTSQLGSKIIKRLASQLRGQLQLQTVNQGTLWRLTFPQKLNPQ